MIVVNEMGRIALEEIMRPVFHETYLHIGLELNHEDLFLHTSKEFGGGVKLIRKPGKLPNKKVFRNL